MMINVTFCMPIDIASCPWAPEVADDEYPMRMRPSLPALQIQEVRSLYTPVHYARSSMSTCPICKHGKKYYARKFNLPSMPG